MTPDDHLRALYARRAAGDQEALERITGRRHGGQDPETGNGETLPDADPMLAEAVASMEGDDQDAD